MARYLVNFWIEKPPGATIAQIRSYIIDELKAAGGQLREDDPLFHGLTVDGVLIVKDATENASS